MKIGMNGLKGGRGVSLYLRFCIKFVFLSGKDKGILKTNVRSNRVENSIFPHLDVVSVLGFKISFSCMRWRPLANSLNHTYNILSSLQCLYICVVVTFIISGNFYFKNIIFLIVIALKRFISHSCHFLPFSQ